MNRIVFDNTKCDHKTVSSQQECWHGPCKVELEYRDGSVWICNRMGNGRRLPKEQIREGGVA